MTWDALALLIARYGPQWAYDFWAIVKDGNEPTETQWQAVLAMSQKSLAQYVAEAQARKDAEEGGIYPLPPPPPTGPGSTQQPPQAEVPPPAS